MAGVRCGCKVDGQHRFYQLSLSKGFTEGHGSSMHEDPTLLPHCTVGAFRPVRRGQRVTRGPGPMKMQQSEEELPPVHLPDAGVQLSQEVGVKVVTQYGVLGVELH